MDGKRVHTGTTEGPFMTRCTAQTWFSTDWPITYSQCVRETGDGHGTSAIDPHYDERDRSWHVFSESKIDLRASERAKYAQRLRSLVTTLEIDGGDAVVVLLGMAERLALGCERYGALDLDQPHDWQLEEDEERWDTENYRAIRRMVARRGAVSRSAARRSTPPADAAAAARDERQARVVSWTREAFGAEQATSLPQRGVRLLEEALEAYQAAGGDAATAHKLVDFVFSRPVGSLHQELGGVRVCVLALAAAAGLSAEAEEKREVERVFAKPIEHFRARNAAKNAAGFLMMSARAITGTEDAEYAAPGADPGAVDELEAAKHRLRTGPFRARYPEDAADESGGATPEADSR